MNGWIMYGRIPQNKFDALVVAQSMTYGDTDQTSQLQRTCLKTGLFPQLGHGFVRRWHRTFIDAPMGIALVVRDPEDQVAAFLLGVTNQQAYVRHVLGHDRFALAWRGAVGLILRPTAARRFLKTRVKQYRRRLLPIGETPRQTSAVGSPAPRANSDVAFRFPSPAPIGVVHAIVTRPTSRGAGYGRILVRQFEKALLEDGTKCGELVTRANGGAPDFYRRLGWSETGRRMDRDGHIIVQFNRVLGRQ